MTMILDFHQGLNRAVLVDQDGVGTGPRQKPREGAVGLVVEVEAAATHAHFFQAYHGHAIFGMVGSW